MQRRCALGLALLPLALGTARAQSYPNQPVKLVVPYPAGGGADAVSRLVAQAASGPLGQQIVVDNKPGAGTIIAADFVAHSKPDGYTVMLADSSTMASNPFLYAKLPYNPEKDLAPVTLVTHHPFLLVSRLNFPARTAAEVVQYARQNPGKVTFASAGPGGPHHLAMELFMVETRTQMVHVPYKGAAPALLDLMGGQVDLMFVDLAAGNNYIKEGKLRTYGVASGTRTPMFPDLPTLSEAGFRDFAASVWTGIVTTAGTPPEAIARLNDAFVKALRSAPVQAQLASWGAEPIPGTPARFTEHMKAESVRLGAVIRAKNISLN